MTLYRYRLDRTLSAVHPAPRPRLFDLDPEPPLDGRGLFVLLNPSTADDRYDDHTVRRLRSIARDLRLARFTIVNLYAFRTPHPSALCAAALDGLDIIGPENDEAIATAALETDVAVAAFGAPPTGRRHEREALRFRPRVAAVLDLLDRPLLCLGETRTGWPRHPARLPDGYPVRSWTIPAP